MVGGEHKAGQLKGVLISGDVLDGRVVLSVLDGLECVMHTYSVLLFYTSCVFLFSAVPSIIYFALKILYRLDFLEEAGHFCLKSKYTNHIESRHSVHDALLAGTVPRSRRHSKQVSI